MTTRTGMTTFTKVSMRCKGGCGKTILVNPRNGKAICSDCRRKGVKTPEGTCKRCGTLITDKTRSIRSRLCVACYAEDMKEKEASRMRLAAMQLRGNDVAEPSDLVPFGGFGWLHANVTPLG